MARSPCETDRITAPVGKSAHTAGGQSYIVDTEVVGIRGVAGGGPGPTDPVELVLNDLYSGGL